MRIGILGGAFDPFHQGHYALVDAACNDAHLRLDKVLLVPSFCSPYKGLLQRSLAERARLIHLAVEPLSCRCSIEVTRIEEQIGVDEAGNPRPNYSYDTLVALRQQYPADTEFVFICGADVLRDIPSWEGYRDLFALTSFAVAPRIGIDTQALADGLRGEFGVSSVHVLAMDEVGVSSTEVRNACAGGNVFPLEGMVAPEIVRDVRKMYCEDAPKSGITGTE